MERDDPRRKKRWFDKKKRACCMLYPRSMVIFWGENEDYWSWEYFQETSTGDCFEVAKLRQVCWFEIEGRINTSELSPKVNYEAVFVIKLSKWAHGWETPSKLRLSLPGGRVHERRIPLLEEPRGEWIEIRIGNFQIEKESCGDIVGNLQLKTGHWKQGLTLKGFMIRPVT